MGKDTYKITTVRTENGEYISTLTYNRRKSQIPPPNLVGMSRFSDEAILHRRIMELNPGVNRLEMTISGENITGKGFLEGNLKTDSKK